MKALFLNTSDVEGGAARAAYRIFSGVQQRLPESRMLVQFKGGDNPHVLGPSTKFHTAWGYLRKHLDGLCPGIYENRGASLFSSALLPSRIDKNVMFFAPDILHLHWVTFGFIGVSNLKRFSAPLIWTLHDSWPFTGGCHIPMDCQKYQHCCGACPNLGSHRERDLSRLVWWCKSKRWQGLNLTIVTPSRWLANCVQKSSLFKELRVEVIPNPIDTSTYKPIDKRIARKALGLPENKRFIACGSLGIDEDKNKGLSLFREAIKLIKAEAQDDVEILMFGASGSNTDVDFSLPLHNLGRLHDDVSLALVYSAADLLVVPSYSENFPNVILEAMACGCPCVGFETGGVPELIIHGLTGLLAKPFKPASLAEQVQYLLQDDSLLERLGLEARDLVVSKFNPEVISDRYLSLYQDVLSARGQKFAECAPYSRS